MDIMSWLFPKKNIFPDFPVIKLDTSLVEANFQQFRETTAEISKAAKGAADVIEEHMQRLKACFQALNSASDAIAILDHEGNIYFCNDSFTQTFNIADYKSIVGKSLKEIVSIPSFNKMWKSVYNNKTWTGTCCHRFNLSALPMMNGAPHPLYIICTFKQKTDK